MNSPFVFELWSISSPLVPCPLSRIYSLEHIWGVPQHEVHAGQEKFVLSDGMTYVLKRPGRKPFQFRVPLRISPLVSSVNVDVADLPLTV